MPSSRIFEILSVEFNLFLHPYRMARQLLLLLAPLGLALCYSKNNSKPSLLQENSCACDTVETKKIITEKNFNRLPRFDDSSFNPQDFYKLAADTNRLLWYRDIENTDTTKFTRLWDDYHRFNYHASHLDFVKYYEGKKDIELAFQFGPNMDLWAYHTFIVRKIGCCYLMTRSYFRHARFNYKAYAILDRGQLDSLYSVLANIPAVPVGEKEEFRYFGYFVDNRNGRKFCTDFQKELTDKTDIGSQSSKKEIETLYEFVDKKINWRITYSI
jgi:hypothetical protein